MSKRRKRKFLFSCVLALSIKSSRVNADLFAEGFALGSYSSKPAISRQIPKCGRSYGIFSRLATSAGSNIPNNYNNSSYFDQSLNCEFTNKQLQKKYDAHAKDFGIMGNYNPKNRDLFRKKLIEHMKSTHACLGTYKGHDVYHYYNPDTKLNVMVDRTNNKFISGWRLSDDQIKYMKLNGKIT